LQNASKFTVVLVVEFFLRDRAAWSAQLSGGLH